MNWTRIAGVTGALGVALGAFGAHALRGRIAEDLLAAYRTGVEYHLVHAVALLAFAASGRASSGRAGLPGWLFLAGIVLFSGSLYAMVLTGQRGFGALTPFGGLCFIGGWLTLA